MGNRLKGTTCRVYDSNLRLRIQRKVHYTYPDVTIICGRTVHDPDDPRQQTVLNPRVIIEVLSESSEAYDRGDKFARYREIDSLEEYVLVSQDGPRIETFLRQAERAWLFNPSEGLEARARLRWIEVELPLAEVYAGVEFAGAAEAADAS